MEGTLGGYLWSAVMLFVILIEIFVIFLMAVIRNGWQDDSWIKMAIKGPLHRE